MKPVKGIVWGICLGFLGVACTGDFKSGETYYLKGEYEKAIKEFNKVLFVHITDVKSLHLRARAYAELEEYEKAIKDYRKIISLDAEYAQAYAGIGQIAWQLGDTKTAEKYLLLAARHDQEDFDILLLLSRSMMKNERFKSAAEFLQLTIEQNPEEPMPHYYLGITMAHLGDPTAVAVSFNNYLRYEPDNIYGHYNRGFAMMRLGFKQWAVEDFDWVLQKNPRHYQAMACRALCILEQDPSKACHDLQTAAKHGNELAKANLEKCSG